MQDNKNINDLQQRFAKYEDMKAYKQLYILLFDGLHRFSYSLVKSHEGAEEIVSDVFIKLWQIRGQLGQVDNLKVYLYTVAKNLSLNYINKVSRKQVVSLDQIPVEAVMDWNSPENLYISREAVNRIKKAVRELPPQCRLIFQLVKEDGLKYKEVAAVLNVSVFTVRNQVAIATRKIAEALPNQRKLLLHFEDRFSTS